MTEVLTCQASFKPGFVKSLGGGSVCGESMLCSIIGCKHMP